VAADLPYMPSVSNVAGILDRMNAAGTPPKFTHDFLKSTLGFASSNDRAIIKVLRQLGFIGADGTPTSRYSEFKGNAGLALANGLREGWAPLFLADQKIYDKPPNAIVTIVKSVTGQSDSVAKKMSATFKALAHPANWTQAPEAPAAVSVEPVGGSQGSVPAEAAATQRDETEVGVGLFRLHHDIHLHLPPTTDVAVYRAIFQAIKTELM
jgi:hypothetical protein